MRHIIVNKKGAITRERAAPPKLVTKTCPYCWTNHETTRRGSVFCTPEHAQRFRAHVAHVKATRETAGNRYLPGRSAA